jgi:hypothetical protein
MGQLQFGDMLLGVDTAARWRDLVGWRDAPDVETNDSPRPQAHGGYPGSLYADPAIVTLVFLLVGKGPAKVVDLEVIESGTRLDGVERALVVHDGAGPTVRWGKVIARHVPMDFTFEPTPIECSIQWKCSDPRRYSLTESTVTVGLASSSGGLDYPLEYPLDYGASVGGSGLVTNNGSADAPLHATLAGPLTNPVLACPDADWTLRFDLTLAAGETLTVSAAAGTVTLDGADRLYTLAASSSPVDACLLPPGQSSVSLAASAGSGSATLTYRHAYL